MYLGIQTEYKSAFAVELGREKNIHHYELLGSID
jgi:hypothetical protein